MKSYTALKSELELKLAELVARAEAVENRLAEPVERDWDESAVTIKNDEILQKIDDATLAEIHEVRLAIHRIESGTYGKCVTCGQPIAEERLSELPYATECIACASRR